MKLNARVIKQLTEPGRYGDGNGLYLHIRPGGSRQWLLRTTIQGKRCDIGLGSPAYVALADARTSAHELRVQAKQGLDPLAERRRETQVPTFREAAETVWEQHRPSWRNEKHAAQWIATIHSYADPHIGNKKVSHVTSTHILEVLGPLWLTKPETARRLSQRLRVVFDWAKASGHCQGDNPVDGVKLALPKQTDQVQHHRALPWRALPDFVAALAQRDGASAKALQFLILTAGRSGEVRGARWSEITSDIWNIPGERMKAKRDHRVPLAPQTLRLLADMRGFSPELVFPNMTGTGPMSDMVFKALFNRMDHPSLTAHGFRSTFRDWVADNAVAGREVAEAALAHVLGDETERAYARSDLFERRRELMNRWAEYAYGNV